jgi:hypothetical protein
MKESGWTWRHWLVGVVMSVVFVAAAVARHWWSSIDQWAIVLLGLGSLPWLTLFFKKIKLPGGIEGETPDRAQSETARLLAPAVSAPSVPPALDQNAVKILATLWRYQKQHFKDDLSKRWTFAVYPNSNAYPSYLRGLAELVNSGLVAVLPSNQVLLTDEGIRHVEQHIDIQKYQDVYLF